MSNANRDKGHRAERHYMREFRKRGFAQCKTARYGSKMHDDAGIDLLSLPFNVQIKAGQQRGLNPSKVLREIKIRILNTFGEHSKEWRSPTILIHHRPARKGLPRDEFDAMVTMSFEDFCKLIEHATY